MFSLKLGCSWVGSSIKPYHKTVSVNGTGRQKTMAFSRNQLHCFFLFFFFPYTTNRAEATLYFFLHPLSTTLHQIAPSSLLNEASARFYTHITKTLLPCTGFLSTTEQGNSQKSSKKKKLFVIISHSEGAIDWQQMICHIKHHVLP